MYSGWTTAVGQSILKDPRISNLYCTQHGRIWARKTRHVAKAVKYESEKQKCRWRAQCRGLKINSTFLIKIVWLRPDPRPISSVNINHGSADLPPLLNSLLSGAVTRRTLDTVPFKCMSGVP